MARNKEETLADKISNILTATPSIFDPEDNLNDYTSAKVDENAVEEENNTDAVLLSQFRKRNTILLDELDKKYAGKKSSRKSFAKYDDGIDYDEENESATSDDSSHGNLNFVITRKQKKSKKMKFHVYLLFLVVYTRNC